MKKLLTAILICIFFLCGCSYSREVNDFAYVIAIGIDESENENILVTFVTAVPSVISSDSGDGEPATLITVSSDNVFTASDKVRSKINRQIDFSHCRLIAFSKSVAEKGLSKYKKTLLNSQSFRPDTLTAVTDGSTYEFFKNSSSEFETNPASLFELMFSDNSSNGSVSCTIKEFSGGREKVLPLVDENGANGCVIIKNDKLTALLNEQQAVIYKLLSGKKFHTYMEFKKEGATLLLSSEKSPDIRIKAEEKMKISVTLHLNGELISENKNISPWVLTNKIKNECVKFLEYTARDINCDIFNFSERTRPFFPDTNSYKSYNPEKRYKDAQFKINIIYSDLKTGERNLTL